MSGHRKPAFARHRSDTGSQALVDYARAMGVEYEPLGGPIDGILWWRGHVRLVDFKAGKKAPLTPRQGKLLARDCPIHFISSTDDVELVVLAMKADADGALRADHLLNARQPRR